ncbi:MAG: hypothetical protein HQM12_03280 [SAR324 cluster bacterium]|nr:hypothetical protein [SAR324 cluster bacterium]
MEKLNELNKKAHELVLKNIECVESVYHTVTDKVLATMEQVDALKGVTENLKSLENRVSNEVFTDIKFMNNKTEEWIGMGLNVPGKSA